jgi:hypothetical protein
MDSAMTLFQSQFWQRNCCSPTRLAKLVHPSNGCRREILGHSERYTRDRRHLLGPNIERKDGDEVDVGSLRDALYLLNKVWMVGAKPIFEDCGELEDGFPLLRLRNHSLLVGGRTSCPAKSRKIFLYDSMEART